MSEPVDPNAYPPQNYPPQNYPPAGYPGYPSQQWPPQQWPPQQWPPQPGWSEPPAGSGRRRRIAVIGVVTVVLLALVGVVVYFSVGSGSSKPGGHVAVPATFAGYTRLHNDISARVESTMRDFARNAGGGAGAQLLQAATIGVYSHNTGDQPVLIAMVVPTSAASTSSPQDIAAELLSGATADARGVAPGSHGGTAQCGDATFGTVAETMCAWSDSHVSGMLVSVNESKSPAELADVMRTFRDHVE